MTAIPSLSPNRYKGIGGSEAAAVLGLSPWKTPYQVYLDKTGQSSGREATPAMEWGLLLEPVIRQRYANVTGRAVRFPVGDEHGHMVCEKHPFMCATLDGITDDGKVLEIKCSRSADGWGEELTDEVPMPYAIQAQHNMVVAGLPVTDLPVLIGGNDFRIYEVPADPELQALLIEQESAFWEMVEAQTPPAPVNYADAVKRFRTSTAREVTASPEVMLAVEELVDLKLKAALQGVREDECKFAVIVALGESDTLVDSDGRPLVTYKQSKDTARFDLKAFQAEHPDLYQKYLATIPGSRRFLLKG